MAVAAVARGISVTIDRSGLVAVRARLLSECHAETQEFMMIEPQSMDEFGAHASSIA